MKRIGVLLAGMAAVLAMAAGSQAAAPTVCNGVFSAPNPVPGDLVVPKGAECDASGIVVQGSVKVMEGASLGFRDGAIARSLEGHGAASIGVSDSAVGKDVTLENGDGPVGLTRVSVNGKLDIHHTFVDHSGEGGGGGKDPGDKKGCPADICVVDTNVGDDVHVHDNSVRGIALGACGTFAFCKETEKDPAFTIGGNVDISKNDAGNGALTFSGYGTRNDKGGVLRGGVSGNVDVHDNTTTSTITVGRNAVGRNLDFHKNRAASNRVTSNSVGKTLNCHDDTPAAAASGNFAEKSKGECAGSVAPPV